jgi:hypothetical protein
MKVQLESTTAIVELNGMKCRVWEGTTESGVKVHALIPRIAAHKDQDLSQFERELGEQAPPSMEVSHVFPLRMVI